MDKKSIMMSFGIIIVIISIIFLIISAEFFHESENITIITIIVCVIGIIGFLLFNSGTKD